MSLMLKKKTVFKTLFVPRSCSLENNFFFCSTYASSWKYKTHIMTSATGLKCVKYLQPYDTLASHPRRRESNTLKMPWHTT